MNRTTRDAVIWALLGGVLCTALDALHVITGTLSYTRIAFGVQDWWVAPQFALAGLSVGFGHRWGAVRLTRSRVVKPSPVEYALSVLAFVGSYGSSGFLGGMPYVALALYTAVFAVGVALAPGDGRPALLLHAGVTALVGPLVEATISGAGLFHYARPDVLGVPLWLPGIYLNAAWVSHVIDRGMTSSSSEG